MDGIECQLIIDRLRIEDVVDYVVQGNTEQMRDDAFMAELKSWIRINDRQAVERRDGLSSRRSGNPSLPGWLSRRLLPLLLTEKSENTKYAKQIRSSAGLAVFCSARNDKPHWMLAGRAYQRFALEATRMGLKHAFINQPVEVPTLRTQLASFLGIGARRPDLMVRFGYGPSVPKSLRRTVDSVIIAAQ